MIAKQEISEQRAHVRVTAPAVVTIDGYKYKVDNWSLGGFQISGFKQKVQVGDCLPIQFCLNCQEGINISTNTLIEVVRLSAHKGKLGARFLNLTKVEKQLLQHFVDSLLQGEITAIECAGQKVDVPVQLFSGSSDYAQTIKVSTKRYSKKALLSILIYILLGSGIGGGVLFSLYTALININIKSAVLTQKIEPVISKDSGTLSQVYVREGMKIKAGQPLFRLNNDEAIERNIAHINALIRNKIEKIDELMQKIQLSRLDLTTAQLELQKTESLRQHELTKQQPYELLAQSKVVSARAKVEAFTVQYQTAKNQLSRFSSLLKAGAISQQSFDTVSAKFADVDGNLRAAQEELKIAQSAVIAVQDGNFYNGDRLIGDLPRLTAEVKDLQGRMQLAVQKIATLEQTLLQQKQDLETLNKQKQNLEIPEQVTGQTLPSVVYKAPISGSILKVVKSLGNTVTRNETLVLLQEDLTQPIIEAYLTQDQADQITKGSRGTVQVPTLNKSYQAQVIEIDRTGGFTGEVKAQYQLRGSQDQSVYMKLVLVAATQADKNQLTPGMPVVLNFTRKINIFDRIVNLTKR